VEGRGVEGVEGEGREGTRETKVYYFENAFFV
jgi:hypothetical protein